MSVLRRFWPLLVSLLVMTPLVVGAPAAAAGTAITSVTTMHVLNGSKVSDPVRFDIGWVEEGTGRYFLADGTNAAVDRFDANNDTFVRLLGAGDFHNLSAADCTKAGAGDPFNCGGPNGVVTDSQGRVWAGDGVNTTVTESSIKALDPHSGTLLANIPTGGKFRSDELAYDPRDQMILVANPDFNDGFLTWIDVSQQSVAGRYNYSPTNKDTWGGLEQPLYDRINGLFYQAVPGVADSAGHVVTAGEIDVFAPVPVDGQGRRVAVFSTPTCLNGLTGLVLTTDQTLVGACDNGAIVVEAHDGSVRTMIPNVGGSDEEWFNMGDHNVYFARAFTPQGGQLGIASALTKRFVTNVPTGTAAHSVAAYEGNNHIFVPVSGGGIRVFASEH